jgi:hypothetical protein
MKLLLSLLLKILSHPQSVLTGLGIGYLLPSDVLTIISKVKAWVVSLKTKL